MADDKTDDKTDAGKGDDGREKAETEFWDKLKANVGGIIDEKLKTLTPTRTDNAGDGTTSRGDSRTGHRQVSIKTLISDLVYGPPKD